MSKYYCCAFVCDLGEEEERELGRKAAAGECPYCGGKVEAVDFECRWRFCGCLPIGFVYKRKYICSLCSKRLHFIYS
ncbi:uncharacterized protein LOC124923777 [Impatiens glandulifera]|uniref:uncharacterized protein LOC124923777 n=1 Tax=Impatiens glandulifera TaxID=253017 RepID=UPI001FB06843|nr:uncharacterized protein LOC124923777 [Impatiens glandulifera]